MFEQAAEPTPIEIELEKTFREADRQDLVNNFRQPEDFARYNQIVSRGDAERENLQDTFAAEFDDRLNARMIELQNKRDAPSHDHPRPSFANPSDHVDLKNQARRDVIGAHQSDIKRSEDAEFRSIEELRHDIQSRDQRQGDAVRDFTKSMDRRNGDDRRVPVRNR